MKRKYTRRGRKKRRGRSRGPKNTIIRKMPLVLQKCVGLIPITAAGALTDTSLSLGFSRYQLGGSLPGANYGINHTKRFLQVYKNYEQYIITGFDLKWIPSNVVAAAVQDASGVFGTVNNMAPIWIWEDIDTLTITGFTDDQILVKDGFKQKAPEKMWHLFRNNKPLAK